jgi:hypothetical protein
VLCTNCHSIIPAISRADNARLYGVASRHQADLPTGEWEQSYSDYAALLADPAIQAVYIPLPNSLHKEWVWALEAGKHVLCEKTDWPDRRRGAEMPAATRRTLADGSVYVSVHRPCTGDRRRYWKAARWAIFDILTSRSASCWIVQIPLKCSQRWAAGAVRCGLLSGELYRHGDRRLPVRCKALCETEQGVDTNLSALLQYDDG